MKFICPLSKNKKLLMFMKDQPINYLNNTQKMIVENQKHIEQLKKRIQLYSKRGIRYLQHLSFLIKRAGWEVKKIYSHCTFEQERFKKDFILMNQTSRQNAKNSIEKDFFKLMNNANLGYDCRNNLDNCQFVPIFDELKEVTYLKRYYNYFDQKVKLFKTSKLIQTDIEEKYNDSMTRLSKDDKFYEMASAIKSERNESLDSLESFDKKNKRIKKKQTIINYAERKEIAYKNNKIKSIIDFDEEQTNSIKSLAVAK